MKRILRAHRLLPIHFCWFRGGLLGPLPGRLDQVPPRESMDIRQCSPSNGMCSCLSCLLPPFSFSLQTSAFAARSEPCEAFILPLRGRSKPRASKSNLESDHVAPTPPRPGPRPRPGLGPQTQSKSHHSETAGTRTFKPFRDVNPKPCSKCKVFRPLNQIEQNKKTCNACLEQKRRCDQNRKKRESPKRDRTQGKTERARARAVACGQIPAYQPARHCPANQHRASWARVKRECPFRLCETSGCWRARLRRVSAGKMRTGLDKSESRR